MPCDAIAPGVIVCRQPYVRTAMQCLTCGRVRPMAGTFGLWYGWHVTCLGCGDSYDSDCCGVNPETGEWSADRDPRPFRRYWQRESIENARRMWRDANPLKLEMRRQREQWAAFDATGVSG